MRCFSPFLMTRGEFLTVKGLMTRKSSPVILNLEHYGRRTIIPIQVYTVSDTSLTGHFKTGYPVLYMDTIRKCELQYEFHDDGRFIDSMILEDMKEYTMTHDIHRSSIKTSQHLRPGDLLLCSGRLV